MYNQSLTKIYQGPVQLVEKKIDNNLLDNFALVKVLTVGLCRTDLYVAQGIIDVNGSVVLGHEACVEIVSCANPLLIGLKAAINPLWPNRNFLGLDFDGVLCNYAKIPLSQLVITHKNIDPHIIAYLEPIAASYAIKKCKAIESGKGAVYGSGRIAELTFKIAQTMGLDVVLIDEKEYKDWDLIDVPSEKFDWIIETQMTDWGMNVISQMLKLDGTLILKSRKTTPTSFIPSVMVKKDITMQAVSYANVDESMRWLEANVDLVKPLIGQVFKFHEWENAFKAAMSAEAKKVFIDIA